MSFHSFWYLLLLSVQINIFLFFEWVTLGLFFIFLLVFFYWLCMLDILHKVSDFAINMLVFFWYSFRLFVLALWGLFSLGVLIFFWNSILFILSLVLVYTFLISRCLFCLFDLLLLLYFLILIKHKFKPLLLILSLLIQLFLYLMHLN